VLLPPEVVAESQDMIAGSLQDSEDLQKLDETKHKTLYTVLSERMELRKALGTELANPRGSNPATCDLLRAKLRNAKYSESRIEALKAFAGLSPLPPISGSGA
jgi:hypothetical protein